LFYTLDEKAMKKNTEFYSMYSAFTSIIIILFATGLVGTASICLAQSAPWTTKADIPTPRWFLSASTVNGKIYAIGGMNSGGLAGMQKVEEYDPATDTWDTTKADMPTGRGYLATAVVNGKIYAFGGDKSWPFDLNFADATEEYDPATDTWTQKADMPTARTGLCACVVDEKIYVFGGQPPVKKNEMYDPATDTWSVKTDMPTARRSPTCGVVNGKIYTFGGIPVNGGPSSDVVEMYDPATDTWSQKAPMPGEREAHATAVVDGKIYIFGGISRGGLTALSNLWVYDPLNDTWKSLADMPLTWDVMGYSVVNKRVYLIAGSSKGSFPFTNNNFKRVEEYYPHNDLSIIVENVNIDKSYAIPGIDSVLITTKMSDPTGITLFAEIEAPDQTPVDSVELFDDGNHGDGSAGDSLFANFWPVVSMEERQYFIDLRVSRVDTDTVNQHLNNMTDFTTKGPVTIEHAEIAAADGVANPGDIVDAKFYFQNNGITATIENIQGRMTILDSCITNDSPFYKPTLISLPAGEVKLARNFFRIKIAENCPIGQIPVQVDIYERENFYWADTFYVDVIVTGLDDKNAVSPNRFVLTQNYPNPFNPKTTIQYQMPKRSEVNLVILSLLGQRVATLVDEVKSIGIYSIQWDGKDDTGKEVASGVYLYRLQTNQFMQVKKLALLR
jgi:N-acetylneuraminic acid mutarotase